MVPFHPTLWRRLSLTVITLSISLTPLLFGPFSRELFEWPKMIAVYSLALISAILLLWRYAAGQPLHIPPKWLSWAILFFLAIFTLSTALSLAPYTSIMGYYTRWQGGLASQIAYLFIAWLLLQLQPLPISPKPEDRSASREPSTERDSTTNSQRLTAKALFLPLLWIATATFISLLAILEHFGIGATCWVLQGHWQASCWVQDVQARVFATFGQPNWLAAYLLTSLPLALALFLSNSSRRLQSLLWLSVVLQFAAFWYTFSRSGWVGLIVLIVLLVIFLPWSKLRQQWLPLLALVLACAAITLTSLDTASQRASTSLEAGDFDSSTGQLRLLVWQSALQLIPLRPLLGSGPETFPYAFLAVRPAALNQTTEWNFLYNKAHNEQLQTVTDRGLLGLASSLAILGALLFTLFRNPPSSASRLQSPASGLLPLPLLLGQLAVMAAQFFGFATVTTALYFWLAIPLIIASTPRPHIALSVPIKLRHRLSLITVLILAIPALSLASHWLYRYTAAEILSTQASKASLYDNLLHHYLRRATRLNPYEPYYQQQQAALQAQQASTTLDQDRQASLVDQALATAQQAESLNPHNLITKKQLAPTYAPLAQINPSLAQSEIDLWHRATLLASTDAAAWQSYAQVLLKHGHVAESQSAQSMYYQLRPQGVQ